MLLCIKILGGPHLHPHIYASKLLFSYGGAISIEKHRPLRPVLFPPHHDKDDSFHVSRYGNGFVLGI